MKKLGELASVHIYFQLLYVHCYYRQTAIFIRNDRGSAEDAQILDELRQLSEQLPLYQQQAQRFFDLVLDVDSAGWEPQAQAARNYTYDAPKDPALQKLRTLLCTDRTGQHGVLRAACSGWPAALPGHRCSEAVDASAGRKRRFQSLPPGVQAALCMDQGRAHIQRGFLRLERTSQSAEKEIRRGDHHLGGLPAMAEGVIKRREPVI